jgi:quercetin dioxygenase-like cupin family protein
MKDSSVAKAPRLSPAKGVEIAILGTTDKLTLCYITAQPGAVIEDHSHPNDQIGTCLKGAGELVSGGKIFRTLPGTSWTIPGGEAHRWKSTSDDLTILVEGFSPPRKDYVSKAK